MEEQKIGLTVVRTNRGAVLLTFPKTQTRTIRCGICDKKIRAHSAFTRFCTECKESDELYHFAEWISA